MADLKDKWYFKTYAFVIAFLCIGPFALPLVWFNPKLSVNKKVVITAITLALTYLIGLVFANSVKSIMAYYQLMVQ